MTQPASMPRLLFPLALLSSVSLTTAGVAQTTPTQTTPAQTTPNRAVPAQSQPAAAPSPDLPDSPGTASQLPAPVVPTGPTALIDTTMGRLVCKLYSTQAPLTVSNFIGLAQGTKDWTDPKTLKKAHNQPFYNGTTFHRVIPNFMIQGGDRAGDGTGDPGYFFKDEIDPALAFDVPGRLAMANAGPATNGSQFFITEQPVPELNDRHTIFGQCDPHTVELVTAIARVERGANDRPVTPVVINKIQIVPEGQAIPVGPAPQPVTAPPTSR